MALPAESFTAPALAAVGVLLLILYLRSFLSWRARTKGVPLPPGPKPLPFVGNMFNMPTFKPWVAFRDLSPKYGDIMYFRVLGQPFVILNTADLVLEYLNKKSAITSDRPQSPLLKISGHDLSLAFMPYGQWWRRHRRAFGQHFNRETSVEYQSTQADITVQFLELLLDDPSHLTEHIKFAFGAAVLKIFYGINATVNDDYLSTATVALEAVSQGLAPGRWLMEHLPFLQYVPTWLPGTSTQKLFQKWKEAHLKMKNMPFEYTKRNTEKEAVSQSLANQMLGGIDVSKVDSVEEEEEVVKNVGATSILAGADTTFSTMQGAFLALSLNPDVVKKAQAELEAVVGPHRLPNPKDQESLPYVNAIVLESLRWHVVVPLAVPHRTIEDDEFHGYFIPAGTNILPNSWACLHDPEAYPDPEVFRPERFLRDGKLNPDVRDPTEFAFGYGRRVCPGRYFAHAGLFVNLASVLHVFNITPPLDENGKAIKIEPEMSDGFLSYPEDCRCSIKPRSSAAEALIRARAEELRV